MALFQIKTIRIRTMKALELLKDYRNIDFGCNMEGLHNEIDEAIKELEDLQNKNKSLVKTLEKYNKEMIDDKN